MNNDRHAILSLLAMGRITPREAERLLAVSSGADETTVRLAVLLAVMLLLVPHANEIVTGFSHVIDVISLWASTAGRHAVALAMDVSGGKL